VYIEAVCFTGLSALTDPTKCETQMRIYKIIISLLCGSSYSLCTLSQLGLNPVHVVHITSKWKLAVEVVIVCVCYWCSYGIQDIIRKMSDPVCRNHLIGCRSNTLTSILSTGLMHSRYCSISFAYLLLRCFCEYLATFWKHLFIIKWHSLSPPSDTPQRLRFIS